MTTATPHVDDPVQALRAATHALHATLDAGLPLSRADASLSDYAQHLRVLKDWQLALSPWLARTGDDAAALALMQLDLRDCDDDTWSQNPGGIDPSAVRARDDGSNAFCWGVRYVLEGSALGGQVLHRRLRNRLAPHPLRYLAERPAVAPRWADTLQALRRELDGPAQVQAGCQGAVAAFEMLIARFRQEHCV